MQLKIGKLPAPNYSNNIFNRQRQRLSQDTQWLALGRGYASPD
jgi:hypothetical protein